MYKKYFIWIITGCLISVSCSDSYKSEKNKNMHESNTIISAKTIGEVEKELTDKYGTADTFRIKRGVRQVASFWTAEDGSIDEYKNFCLDNFIDSETELAETFKKISRNMEILSGNMNRISMDLKTPLDLDMGEIKKIDMMFGGYNPASHIQEDFYRNKIAFYILLNFPFYSLEEKNNLGKTWSRKEWAFARLGDFYISRVPSDIIQEYSQLLTNTEAYIAEYNIYMGNILNNKNEKLFPADLKLISHWGLRDELESNYNSENGLEKQKLIFDIMNRIITQEIPAEVINSDKYLWNPSANELYEGTKKIDFAREADIRYQKLLDIFNGARKFDPYFPNYPDNIKREFELNMEIPQKEVENLFIELLSSGQIKKVSALISKRLGRKLEPFDIWYNGFGSEKGIPEEELNNLTRKKYPTNKDFEKDIPFILTRLGFTREKAEYIASKITVDASRGAGHAWGSQMRTDKAHLRTRVEKNGMNYKGYNIAIHELGHNVEQTLSLYNIDYYLLNGVPNTAFTEALAFLFQKRDLDILGVGQKIQPDKNMLALDIVWTVYEIMGVSLVDMYVWQWLYDHPDVTAGQLKEAVINIAKDVWNKYYSGIFGIKDQDILAIYSHMITYPLYLSAYPVGYLIQFQIEKYIQDKNTADEIQRLFSQGRLTPQQWLKQGVGEKLSCKPLLESVDEALSVIN
jgi:hypothetical protein